MIFLHYWWIFPLLYELQVYRVGPNRDLEGTQMLRCPWCGPGFPFPASSDGDLDAGPLHIIARETLVYSHVYAGFTESAVKPEAKATGHLHPQTLPLNGFTPC